MLVCNSSPVERTHMDRTCAPAEHSVQSSRTDWHNLYRKPLLDLGTSGNEDFSGIYSHGYDPETVSQYVQAQFLRDAETYVAKYTNTDYWRRLIRRAFDTAGIDSPVNEVILDLGSGAGNTIFPLLELCPRSTVIASDLSARMLALCKKALPPGVGKERIGLLELNAEDLDFDPGSFDLVVGGAILHHLLRPELTLEGCARILKPGGHAIFFEPFENGNAILGHIYNIIASYPEFGLPSDIKRFFKHFAHDLNLRKGRDKSAPIYRQMDDKWYFTRRYFEEFAERFGFSRCTIYPLHGPERQFERQTEVYLRLALNRAHKDLPEWAWEMLRQFDAFSDDLKNEMLIEGCIILRK